MGIPLVRYANVFIRYAVMSSLLFILFWPNWIHAEPIRGGIEYTENSYHVGPGDVLSMSVYNQEDLGQNEIVVREDGYATFPGVGDIFVAGNSVAEVTEKIKIRLSELVVDPIITISINQSRPGTVYITGAVMRPGMYQLSTMAPNGFSAGQNVGTNRVDFKVSNILSTAGGVLLNADLSQVEVRKADTGEIKHVNLWRLLKDGVRDEDLRVQSGDTIYVPTASSFAMSDADFNLLLRSFVGPGTYPVRVMGEVTTPGVVQLTAISPHLNSAIAQAGGLRNGANRKMVYIRRFTNETHAEDTAVDPNQSDIVLRPNDIVFVPEQKIAKMGRILDTVARIFAPFNTFSSVVVNFRLASQLRN